jgi:hypothetical protein
LFIFCIINKVKISLENLYSFFFTMGTEENEGKKNKIDKVIEDGKKYIFAKIVNSMRFDKKFSNKEYFYKLSNEYGHFDLNMTILKKKFIENIFCNFGLFKKGFYKNKTSNFLYIYHKIYIYSIGLFHDNYYTKNLGYVSELFSYKFRSLLTFSNKRNHKINLYKLFDLLYIYEDYKYDIFNFHNMFNELALIVFFIIDSFRPANNQNNNNHKKIGLLSNDYIDINFTDNYSDISRLKSHIKYGDIQFSVNEEIYHYIFFHNMKDIAGKFIGFFVILVDFSKKEEITYYLYNCNQKVKDNIEDEMMYKEIQEKITALMGILNKKIYQKKEGTNNDKNIFNPADGDYKILKTNEIIEEEGDNKGLKHIFNRIVDQNKDENNTGEKYVVYRFIMFIQSIFLPVSCICDNKIKDYIDDESISNWDKRDNIIKNIYFQQILASFIIENNKIEEKNKYNDFCKYLMREKLLPINSVKPISKQPKKSSETKSNNDVFYGDQEIIDLTGDIDYLTQGKTSGLTEVLSQYPDLSEKKNDENNITKSKESKEIVSKEIVSIPAPHKNLTNIGENEDETVETVVVNGSNHNDNIEVIPSKHEIKINSNEIDILIDKYKEKLFDQSKPILSYKDIGKIFEKDSNLSGNDKNVLMYLRYYHDTSKNNYFGDKVIPILYGEEKTTGKKKIFLLVNSYFNEDDFIEKYGSACINLFDSSPISIENEFSDYSIFLNVKNPSNWYLDSDVFIPIQLYLSSKMKFNYITLFWSLSAPKILGLSLDKPLLSEYSRDNFDYIKFFKKNIREWSSNMVVFKLLTYDIVIGYISYAKHWYLIVFDTIDMTDIKIIIYNSINKDKKGKPLTGGYVGYEKHILNLFMYVLKYSFCFKMNETKNNYENKISGTEIKTENSNKEKKESKETIDEKWEKKAKGSYNFLNKNFTGMFPSFYRNIKKIEKKYEGKNGNNNKNFFKEIRNTLNPFFRDETIVNGYKNYFKYDNKNEYEFMGEGNTTFFGRDIKIKKYRKINIPDQGNSFDCGLYTILNAKHVIDMKNIPKESFGTSFELRKKTSIDMICDMNKVFDFVTYPNEDKKLFYKSKLDMVVNQMKNIRR